jgi:hypothetical protein
VSAPSTARHAKEPDDVSTYSVSVSDSLIVLQKGFVARRRERIIPVVLIVLQTPLILSHGFRAAGRLEET